MQHFDSNQLFKTFIQQRFKTVLTLFFSMVLAITASANTFNVNTTNDTHAVNLTTGDDGTGHVSFRSALEAANNLGGSQTINVPSGTYNLTLGMITMNDIAENITISGAGAATTIINMTTTLQDRILLIGTSGLQPNMITSISGLTFKGGKEISDDYGGGAIIAGGPSNSLTLTNCIFQNNTIDPAAVPSSGVNSGGAVRYNGGGTLSIDNCQFTGNSTPTGEGGAVSYFLENLASAGNGSLSITNSTFTNNTVTGTGGAGGGALSIAAQGRIIGGVTFTVSVLNNTFTGNAANTATSGGGAIVIDNGFDIGNTVQVHYNRIVGNTAASGPSGLGSNSAQGNVDATNNWWGCNVGPNVAGTCDRAAIIGSGGVGTLNTSSWMQLKLSASPTQVCSGATSTVTASFLTNNLGAALTLGNLSRVIGLPITFSAALGSLSAAQPTIQASATATVTYTAGGVAGAGSVNGVVDNIPVADAVAKAAIQVSKPVVNNPGTSTGTAGTAFSQTFTQSGGIAGFTYTTASTLPTGLSLSPAGVLSGTPTQVGTFPITVTVTDGIGCTGTNALAYNLQILCQTITVNNPATTTGTVNVAFSQNFTQTNAIGATTFTTASTLPTGFTLSPAGLLSGTTTQHGTFPITVTVTDGNLCTGTGLVYNLVISCQTINVTNPAVTTGTNGTAFNQVFNQSGALSGATFTLNSGTLPNGLSLSAGGVLSGTPSAPAGTYPITVLVTDGNGCTGISALYNLTIGCQPITVTDPGVNTGQENVAFSQTFTQGGAIGGATFSTASTLPTGLTLSTAGVLSGTPAAGSAGSYPITVTVTDGNGCTGTGVLYTLVISACPVITVTNPGVTTGTAGTAFSQNFTQSGGALPVSFSTASTLPTGLSLSAAGVLSGTPTQAGTFPITVTVTDNNSCTGTGVIYNLVISCPAPQTATATPSSQIICSGATITTIALTGVVIPGTVYNWSRDNTGTVTGIAGSGSGDISGALTNTTAGPVTVTFFITPLYYGTCVGNTTTATVTVNPTPNTVVPASQAFCNSTTITTGTLNFTSTNTPAGTTTFSWTNSNTAIGLGASGSGNSLPTFTTTNATSGPISGTITVTPSYTNAGGGPTCTGPSQTFTITVNPTPDVTQPANQTVCNGASTAPVNFTGSVAGTTFNWTNNTPSIGLAASGSGDIASFTGTNPGTGPVTATITVTPSTSLVPELLYYKFEGAGTSIPNLASLPPAGTTTATIVGGQTQGAPAICGAGSLIGSGSTTDFVNTGWAPNLGNSSWTMSFKTSNITPSATLFYILGDGNTSSWRCFTNGVAGANNWILRGPVSDVLVTGGATVAPHTITFVYDNAAGNIKAYLDGVLNNTVAQAPLNITGAGPFEVGHYIAGNTGLNAGGQMDEFSLYNRALSAAQVTALAACSGGALCTGTPKTFTITVNPTATVNAVGNQVVCNGATQPAITFSSPTTGGSIVYNWTNNTPSIGLAASGSGNIAAFTATNATVSPVTATIQVTPAYTNNGVTCNGTPISFTITVNPTANVTVPANQIFCNGATITTGTLNFTSTNTPAGQTTYTWTNSNTAIGLGASGAGNSLPTFTTTNATVGPISGTITVIPTYTNGAVPCTGPSQTFTITVNPTPNVAVPANQIYCNGTTVTTGTLNFTSTNTPAGQTTFTWANSNVAIGLGASGAGNSLPTFTTTNATAGPISGTITVTPIYTNAGGGPACSGPTQTFTITVNPTPNVAVPANQIFCNGATITTGTLNFTSTNTPAGTTTFAWTNSNVAIGLGASGAGNSLPTFTTTNATLGPISGTITVTPSYTNAGGGPACTGPSQTFTITVNPTPNVAVPANQIFCNGSTITTGTLNFTSTNTPAGQTTYTWVNSNVAIGLGASGAGNSLPTFTTTNATAGPISGTITVTPIYTNAGGGPSCSGATQTFTITVNPTPNVAVPANQIYCNGTTVTTGTLNFTSTNTPAGTTTFTWTNSNVAIGLGASGAGNSLPTFTTTNATLGPISGTITVTPHYTNAGGGPACTGPTQTFTITVNPTPNVAVPANQTYCPGITVTTGTLNFTSTNTPAGQTSFTWINSNTAIGLGASGAGNSLPTFTTTNGTFSPIVGTITVTPIYTNAGGGPSCTGPSQAFTITVNPTPNVIATPSSQITCSGQAITTIVMSSSVAGTTYAWTRDNVATVVGIPASGSGNISGTFTNTTFAPITVTFTITPTANGCVGPSTTATVTVNPTPDATATPSSQASCSSSPITTIVITGSIPGTVFNWTRDNVATVTGIAASGTGNISGTLTNTTNAPVTVTFTIIPTVFGCSPGTPTTATVLVEPTPQVNQPASQTVCNGSSTAPVVFTSPTSGGVMSYNWTNNTPSIGLAASGSGNIPSFVGTNATVYPLTATITVTPTAVFPVVAGPITQTFNYTGALQTFTVPAGVTSITINASGAQGAGGNAGSDPSSGSTGGKGTKASGTLTVTPGQVLNIYVGGAGGTGAGGFNGGGNGGNSLAGGGGGASDVRFPGTASTDRIIVGAGGGGGGRGGCEFQVAFGGNGGNGDGNGANGANATTIGGSAGGGFGAIGSTFGSKGIGCSGFLGADGVSGLATGIGGNGGNGQGCCCFSQSSIPGGGGGGGGYFGGGGGGGGSAGTVGCSGNDKGAGGGGAGGTSYTGGVAGGSTTTGVQAGNGVVTITYNVLSSITCTGPAKTFTITVNPIPTVSPVASVNVCNGNPVTGVNFTGTVPGTIYNWTNSAPSIGLAASGSGAGIPGFIAINNGNTPVTATITVTPTFTYNGVTCTGSSTSFTITVLPTPTVSQPANQVVCNNTPTAAVTFTGPVAGTIFSWTNSNPAIGLAASGTGNIPSFTAVNATNNPLTAVITVTPSSPLSGIVATATPTITLNGSGGCTPMDIAYNPLQNLYYAVGGGSTGCGIATFNASGTQLLLTIPANHDWRGLWWNPNGNTLEGNSCSGCGVGGIRLQDLNGSGYALATGTVVLPSNQPDFQSQGDLDYTNNEIIYYNGGIIYRVNRTTGANLPNINITGLPVSTTNLNTYLVGYSGIAGNEYMVFDYVLKRVYFINRATGAYTATSQVPAGAPSTTQNWGTGFANGQVWIFNGSAWVGYQVAVAGAPISCSGPAKTFSITVNPTPTVNAVSNQTLCNGAPTAAVNFNGNVAGTVYNWTNSNTAIGLAASGTGSIPSFTATNATAAPISGTVTVTPSYTNAGVTCTGTAISFTITVNPTPTVSAVSNQTVCNGASTAAVTFSGTPAGVVFTWVNNNPAIGLAAGGTGNIPAFTAVNAGTVPVVATITVTPSTNNGVSCTGASTSFTITVNPTAVVNAVASQVVCNGGSTTAVNFSGPVAGTVFNWTNNTPSIGLAASGTGNIASFVAINAGAAPVVATITVTPTASGCVGASTSFTITVNPTATVTAVANQVVCNGTATAAVNFTSPTTGGTIVYNWTNNNTTIGLAAAGTGNIAPFIAINNTTGQVVATITVTPTYTNGGVSCVGTPTTFTITVNPTPVLSTVLTNQVVCNGTAIAALPLFGPSVGTIFLWTNNQPSIGLGGAGVGNIPAFTATNAGTAPVVATITITPSLTLGGVTCTGPARSFTITVNPTPAVNAIANQTLCSGAVTSAVTIAGPVPGTVYNWTNSNTSIGLAASGSGNIGAFTAINNTAAPVTSTITVTPVYTNAGVSCVGTAITFTITVNPVASVNGVASQTVCAGSTTTAVSFSGPVAGTVFTWTNSNTAIGLAASGTGNIAAFTATNATTAAISGTITVTPVGPGGTCTGASTSFTITVNPTVTVNAIANQTVCAGSSTAAVTPASPTAGVAFSWTNNNTTIGLGASGVGPIPSFTAVNPTQFPVTATITVTPSYTNGGITCTGTPRTFTITVNPGANIIATNVPIRVCLTDTLVVLTATPTGGVWAGPGVAGNTFNAATAGVGVKNITYTASNGFGCSGSFNINVTVNDCMERHNVFKYAIRIYPNPSSGVFNIRFLTDVYKEFDMNVIDAGGAIVGHFHYTNLLYGSVIPVNVHNLPAGYYRLEVYNTLERATFPIEILH